MSSSSPGRDQPGTPQAARDPLDRIARPLHSMHGMLMALVAVALVPVLGLSLWGHMVERDHERQLAEERTAHVAGLIADELARETRNTRMFLALVSADSQVRSCTGASQAARCAQVLADFAQLAPEYLNLHLVRPNGSVLASARPRRCKAGLQGDQAVRDVQRGQPFAMSVRRTDATPPGQDGAENATSEPEAGGAVVTYAAPVPDDKDGAPLVLAARMALTQASKTILNAGMPRGTSVVLAGLNGHIIFRIPDEPGYVGAALPKDHAELIAKRTAGTTGWATGLDGLERYYVLRRLDIGGEGVCYVRVGIPKGAVYAESTAKLSRQISVLLVITLLALVFTRLWARRNILAPVQRLMDAVRALSAGDYAARAGLSSGIPGGEGEPGELGELARTFDRMAEGLEFAHAREEAARKALLESEERLRAVFNASADGMLLLVPDGRVLSMNESAAKRRNASPADLVGKNILDLIPEYVRNGRRHRFEEVVHTRAPLRFEEEREGRTYAIRLYPIFGEDGNVCQIASFSRDITERRLSERALMAAKETAEAASRAKDSFITNMSHELRTPLHGIEGMLQLLAMAELSDEQREYLGHARGSARQLTALINDILDYAALGSGRLILEHKPFTLGPVLDDLAQELGPAAEAKGLTLSLAGQPGALDQTLMGDPKRLGMALRQLLDNALKFTHQGGVTLDAALACRAEGDCTLRIQVADTGIGIAPEQMQGLFEPFVQAEDPLTKSYPGTGLGLAIVRELVKAMGGIVEAASTPGQGSVFTLSLSFQTPPDGLGAAI